MFERFTDRSRRVLTLAHEEARLFNHGFIGTEHILLGLLGEGHGIAYVALDSLGVTITAARHQTRAIVGVADVKPKDPPPFTPRAKKVLELALREALQLGHHDIGTEHLLLGLIREGEGVGVRVLANLGVEVGPVRQAVIQLMSGHGGQRVVTRGEPTPSPAHVAGPPGEPLCPQCRARISTSARFRTLEVPPGPDDEGAAALPVLVVYCSECGMSLDMFATPRSD